MYSIWKFFCEKIHSIKNHDGNTDKALCREYTKYEHSGKEVSLWFPDEYDEWQMHDEESGDIIRIAKGTIGSTAFPGDLHHSGEEGIDMEVFEEGEEGDERG